MQLLVFGGNGFIGGECVNYLLNQGHAVTLLNRAHWPWDSAIRIKPKVKHVYCDRLNPGNCSELKNILSQSHFDAVIDFSALKPKLVAPFYDLLKNHVDLYIYISSDSTYEVCQKFDNRIASKEEFAVRPNDSALRSQLAQFDDYGDGKMEVEEYLTEMQGKAGGIPFVFLRLPDVLGERDTTYRWWKYQMWMEYQGILNVPVVVPRHLESLYTSYVDVLDVANVIQTILPSKIPVRNKIYNVALENPMKLSDLLAIVKEAAGCPDVKIEIVDGEQKFPSINDTPTGALKIGGDFYFPSVTRGPIDITKIRTELNWCPVKDFSKRAKEIADFYKTAWKLFPDERLSLGLSLLADLGDRVSHDRKIVFEGLLKTQEH